MKKQIVETEVFHCSNEILSADYHDRYGVIAICEGKRYLKVSFKENTFTIKQKIDFPKIRWINDASFIVIDSRVEREKDNVFIFGITGELTQVFHGGDAIQDVVVTKKGIWISYFDEGVFGRGLSTEGLVLFDFNGKPLYKYNANSTHKTMITDCYAMCEGESDSVWVYPYTEFPLVNISINKPSEIYYVINKLHGANAISYKNKHIYLHAPYAGDDFLYSWSLETSEAEEIGKLEGNLRGIRCYQYSFLKLNENKVSLISII